MGFVFLQKRDTREHALCHMRRLKSASGEKDPHQVPGRLIPSSQTPSLQACEKINVCYLSL